MKDRDAHGLEIVRRYGTDQDERNFACFWVRPSSEVDTRAVNIIAFRKKICGGRAHDTRQVRYAFERVFVEGGLLLRRDVSRTGEHHSPGEHSLRVVSRIGCAEMKEASKHETCSSEQNDSDRDFSRHKYIAEFWLRACCVRTLRVLKRFVCVRVPKLPGGRQSEQYARDYSESEGECQHAAI